MEYTSAAIPLQSYVFKLTITLLSVSKIVAASESTGISDGFTTSRNHYSKPSTVTLAAHPLPSSSAPLSSSTLRMTSLLRYSSVKEDEVKMRFSWRSTQMVKLSTSADFSFTTDKKYSIYHTAPQRTSSALDKNYIQLSSSPLAWNTSDRKLKMTESNVSKYIRVNFSEITSPTTSVLSTSSAAKLNVKAIGLTSSTPVVFSRTSYSYPTKLSSEVYSLFNQTPLNSNETHVSTTSTHINNREFESSVADGALSDVSTSSINKSITSQSYPAPKIYVQSTSTITRIVSSSSSFSTSKTTVHSTSSSGSISQGIVTETSAMSARVADAYLTSKPSIMVKEVISRTETLKPVIGIPSTASVISTSLPVITINTSLPGITINTSLPGITSNTSLPGIIMPMPSLPPKTSSGIPVDEPKSTADVGLSTHSSVATAINTRTRIITIRKGKKRGLPPWAVITVAVGAFLFVCLIALAAFKIVQWNKDHGDYKLWSTDLELTPITSRNEKDGAYLGSDDYERPVDPAHEDIHIYSKGRCVSVVKAKKHVGDLEVDISYPIISEESLIQNNNHNDFHFFDYTACHEGGQSLSATAPLTPSTIEANVFNMKLSESPIKDTIRDVFAQHSQVPSISYASHDTQKEETTESKDPKYTSLDDRGMVCVNLDDILNPLFDPYKPLPPIPVEYNGERRLRTSSFDSQVHRIPCETNQLMEGSKSNPDFLESRNVASRPTRKYSCPCDRFESPLSFPGNWRTPSTARKGCSQGEHKIAREIEDVSKILVGNSQEHIEDIDFSSNRRAGSLPRSRRHKRSLETRHWPLIKQSKKCQGHFETQSLDSQASTESVHSTKSCPNEVMTRPETLPRQRKRPPIYPPFSSVISQSFDKEHCQTKSKCKDFVEVEIGRGRPRLIDTKMCGKSSFDAASMPRERSVSTSFVSPDCVREARKRNDTTLALPPRKTSLQKLEHNFPITKSRKHSSPANCYFYNGSQPDPKPYATCTFSHERSKNSPPVHGNILPEEVRDIPVLASHSSNRDKRGFPPSPDGISTSPFGGEELDDLDPVEPYAEVRMSAIFDAQSGTGVNQGNLVLPYLTVKLQDNDYSPTESGSQAGGYLKLVPKLPGQGDMPCESPTSKVHRESGYSYPDQDIRLLRSITDRPLGGRLFDEKIESNQQPSNADNTQDHWYAEIDESASRAEGNSYATLTRERKRDRFSVLSLPEPGYEVVKKRDSLLVTPSRDSVDSAVFSASEELLRTAGESDCVDDRTEDIDGHASVSSLNFSEGILTERSSPHASPVSDLSSPSHVSCLQATL